MKKHFYRNLAIWAVLIFTVIWIYPTIGAMFMSPEAKERIRATIKEEDSVYTPPSLMKDINGTWSCCPWSSGSYPGSAPRE